MGGSGAGGGGGGGDGGGLEALLKEFPALARLDDGRVKCNLTGHVMQAKPDVIQPYVRCAPTGPNPPTPHPRLISESKKTTTRQKRF